MTLSANELIDQLSRYGLINRLSQGNTLNSLDVDQASDSEIVVSRLVDRGPLTQFQARVIRAGQIPNLLVDQYVILDKLGEGGMGVVFKARHKLMDPAALQTSRTGTAIPSRNSHAVETVAPVHRDGLRCR